MEIDMNINEKNLTLCLIHCSYVLRESAKQHRAQGDHGHAQFCETARINAEAELLRQEMEEATP
jgi:hypothetical protein